VLGSVVTEVLDICSVEAHGARGHQVGTQDVGGGDDQVSSIGIAEVRGSLFQGVDPVDNGEGRSNVVSHLGKAGLQATARVVARLFGPQLQAALQVLQADVFLD